MPKHHLKAQAIDVSNISKRRSVKKQQKIKIHKGQGYDGAVAVAGEINNVAANITEINSKAIMCIVKITDSILVLPSLAQLNFFTKLWGMRNN